jgi:DnaJ-class molecular chaperone
MNTVDLNKKQWCPRCKGTGKYVLSGNGSAETTCSLCRGERIIKKEK